MYRYAVRQHLGQNPRGDVEEDGVSSKSLKQPISPADDLAHFSIAKVGETLHSVRACEPLGYIIGPPAGWLILVQEWFLG